MTALFSLEGVADPAGFIRRQTVVRTASHLVPELQLHLADEALPLWQASEELLKQIDAPPPYWAFAWPGGQALARLLFDCPQLARHRRVIDFGAGSGIAAIAAACVGAHRVLACDHDPFALIAIELNARLNGVTIVTTGRDAMESALDCDLLLLGDVCYEKKLAERTERWARALARVGVEVLLADPGRAYAPCDRLVEMKRYTVPTSLDLEDRIDRETVVWRVLDKEDAPLRNEL